MTISQVKRGIIEKLSQADQPMSRFDLMMSVLEPELSTFRHAMVEFINIGDVEVTIDWQLRLRKEIREANLQVKS